MWGEKYDTINQYSIFDNLWRDEKKRNNHAELSQSNAKTHTHTHKTHTNLLLFRLFAGDTDKLSVLIRHQSPSIKSRTCSLVGNLMKHNAQMYTFLKQREKLFEGLMACLKDEDQNVRKVIKNKTAAGLGILMISQQYR